MLVPTTHADFDAQRAFLALSQQDQLLQIWLNGRETNGKVADVIREMTEVKRDLDDNVRPKVERHDRLMAVAAGIIVVIMGAAPFVFWGLDKIIGQ